MINDTIDGYNLVGFQFSTYYIGTYKYASLKYFQSTKKVKLKTPLFFDYIFYEIKPIKITIA